MLRRIKQTNPTSVQGFTLISLLALTFVFTVIGLLAASLYGNEIRGVFTSDSAALTSGSDKIFNYTLIQKWGESVRPLSGRVVEFRVTSASFPEHAVASVTPSSRMTDEWGRIEVAVSASEYYRGEAQIWARDLLSGSENKYRFSVR